jgi:hypothetical protein
MGALKSHNLQIKLTGHSTCQSRACLVTKRYKTGFRQKIDELGTVFLQLTPTLNIFSSSLSGLQACPTGQ